MADKTRILKCTAEWTDGKWCYRIDFRDGSSEEGVLDCSPPSKDPGGQEVYVALKRLVESHGDDWSLGDTTTIRPDVDTEPKAWMPNG